MARHPSTGRIPASRYFGGGSRFPKYRKPTNFKSLPKVSRVQKQGTRTWLVEFEDGMGVFVNEADNPGRFYTLRVHDRVRWYEEQRPEPPPDEARRYQYAALTSVVPHQSAFHIDPYGHLMADVDELYPRGDMSRRRSSSRARDTRQPTRDYEYVVYPEPRVSGEGVKIRIRKSTFDLTDAKAEARRMGYPAGIYSVSKGRFVGYIGRAGRYVPFGRRG